MVLFMKVITMLKIKWGKRSLINLSNGLEPRLVHIAMELQKENVMYDAGVFETKRTPERQKSLVAQGFSQTLNSKHIPNKNGVVRAMDIVAYVNGEYVWDRKYQDDIVSAIRRVITRLGYDDIITLGADYKSFYDGYHIELKGEIDD